MVNFFFIHIKIFKHQKHRLFKKQTVAVSILTFPAWIFVTRTDCVMCGDFWETWIWKCRLLSGLTCDFYQIWNYTTKIHDQFTEFNFLWSTDNYMKLFSFELKHMYKCFSKMEIRLLKTAFLRAMLSIIK